MPHAKQLRGYPVSELRVKQGSDILRLFYFRRDSVTYTITSGYIKKTDKTSRKEIERAVQLRTTVLEAGNGDS